MATANEIAKRQIDGRSPAFASEIPVTAQEQYDQLWQDYDFCPDTEAPAWEAAGVWCPYVAEVCRDAGVTPQQIGERVAREFADLVCKGDRRARDLVEAAR